MNKNKLFIFVIVLVMISLSQSLFALSIYDVPKAYTLDEMVDKLNQLRFYGLDKELMIIPIPDNRYSFYALEDYSKEKKRVDYVWVGKTFDSEEKAANFKGLRFQNEPNNRYRLMGKTILYTKRLALSDPKTRIVDFREKPSFEVLSDWKKTETNTQIRYVLISNLIYLESCKKSIFIFNKPSTFTHVVGAYLNKEGLIQFPNSKPNTKIRR